MGYIPINSNSRNLQGKKASDFMRGLQLVLGGIIVGLISVIAVIYFVVKPPVSPDLKLTQTLQFCAVGFWVVSILASMYLYKIMGEKNSAKPTLREKLESYSGQFIVRMALTEAPALASVVFYITTGHILFIFLAIWGVLFLIQQWPSVYRVSSALNLSDTEQSFLLNPENVIE